MRFAARMVCAVLAAWLSIGGALADHLDIDSTVPDRKMRATLSGELVMPEGSGPWPAIVFMHGCGGLDDDARQALADHAHHFAAEGFVGLILDSFGPRDIDEVCRNEVDRSAALDFRMWDAFDARAALAGLSFVDRDNIFLFGQNHGASVAIRVAVAEYVDRIEGAAPFRAVAALYPWCGEFVARPVRYVSPLRLFVGDHDTWTPYTLCTDLPVLSGDADVRLVLYQDAGHAFDVDRPERVVHGHRLSYNAIATADSRKRVLALFRHYLVGRSAQLVPSKVLALQARLAALGFDPGAVDGVWSNATLTALNALRSAHGLRPVKYLDAESLDLLSAQP